MISSRVALLTVRAYKHSAAGIVLGLGTLLLTSCVVGPNYQRPTAQIPQAYKENGNWKLTQPNDEKLRGNWWELFGDPQLNALEQQVNVSNQNLKAQHLNISKHSRLCVTTGLITIRR